MKTLLFLLSLLFLLNQAKAIDFPALNLEIGKTYRIETTTHIDTSAQWGHRFWDYRKWDLTPVSYDVHSKNYKIKAVLKFYQRVVQQKFDHRGWMENDVYETGYLGSYRSPIVYLNAYEIPVYFTLSSKGEVSNIDLSAFKNYNTPEGYNLGSSSNSQLMIKGDLKLIFLKFDKFCLSEPKKTKLKNGFNKVEGDDNVITLAYNVPEDIHLYEKLVDGEVIIDKTTGLVLRNHLNYLIPHSVGGNTPLKETVWNHAVYFQKYIPEYECNSTVSILKNFEYVDTILTSSNFKLKGQIDKRIEGDDSITISVNNRKLYKLPLDENNQFEVSLFIEEPVLLQVTYSDIMVVANTGREDQIRRYKGRLHSISNIYVEPGDNIKMYFNSSENLLVDSIRGIGAENNKLMSGEYFASIGSNDISPLDITDYRKGNIDKLICNSREKVTPQKYLLDLFNQTYGRHFGPGLSSKNNYNYEVIVNNMLARNNGSYKHFLDQYIDRNLDAVISMATGVDSHSYGTDLENNYFVGQVALSDPVRSMFSAYYMEKVIQQRQWDVIDRLYASFKQNYEDKPVFEDVEKLYDEYKRIAPGQPMLYFELNGPNGKKLTKADLDGKVTVLFFFSAIEYRLNPNRKSGDLEEFSKFYRLVEEEYPGQVEFVFILMGYPEDMKELEGKIPQYVNVYQVLPFPYSDFLKNLNISNTSFKYFILDRNGNISYNNPRWHSVLIKVEVEKALAIPYQKSSNNFPLWLRLTVISLIGALLAIVLTFFIYRNIIKRRLKKSEFNKKMRELELTAIRAQMNPHFMYNCLNSIQNLVQKNRNDEAHLYLSKFASLIRRVLNTSKKEDVSISEELETIREYIDLEKLRFDFDFQLKLEEDIDPVSVFVPPMLLQPFVENALLHGLVPKAKDRKLKVHVYRNHQQICIDIEDNGIGRKQSKQNGSSGHGKGIEMSQERLKLLGDKYQTPFYFNIVDLTDTDNLPLGTRVSLCFNEE